MAVYKDNNGTWYISVRYVNWKGEHARKVKRGFATKREATDWERNFLHENAGNLDMSFETFVDLYKKNLKERLKLSTWQTKVSIIDTKILPYFKKKRINDIKVSDVVAWQNTLLNMEDENGEEKDVRCILLSGTHNGVAQMQTNASIYNKITLPADAKELKITTVNSSMADLRVQVLKDDDTLVNLSDWTRCGAGVSEQTIDISAYAGQTVPIYINFSDGNANGSGANIIGIEITQ